MSPKTARVKGWRPEKAKGGKVDFNSSMARGPCNCEKFTHTRSMPK